MSLTKYKRESLLGKIESKAVLPKAVKPPKVEVKKTSKKK